MKEVDAMMNPEEDTANGPGYASLTAGLLARKGEAVPAAAAFTAEAIAQHIPARRLAQEAERILTQTSDELPDLESAKDPAAEIQDVSDGQAFEPGSEFAEQHERIEDLFAEPEEAAFIPTSPRENLNAAHSALEHVAREPLDLPAREPLDLPERHPEFAFAEESPSHASLSVNPLSLEEQQEKEANPIPGLDESDENWFEDIVSKAISEADHTRNESVQEASVERFPVEARPPVVDDADIPSRPKKPAQSCGTKVAKVRQSIQAGNPRAAAKSAMRLDPRRFIRLSLASRKLGLSNQELMMAALDAYLDTLDEEVFSECSCMKKGLI